MRPKGRLRSTGIISFAIGKDLKKKDATVFIKRSAFFLRPIRCSTGRPNLRRRRARTRFGPACCVLYAAARGIGFDMWISDRLEIGLENARRLANAGNGAAALEQIESFVTLLEQTMAITDEQTLGSSCEWMEGACYTEGQRILEEQI